MYRSDSGGRTATWISWLVGLALATLVAGGLAMAQPAAAQTTTTTTCEYPFDSCVTTTVPRTQPTIELGAETVVAGQVLAVRACGYVVGTSVTFSLGGTEVAQRGAGADGCASDQFVVPNLALGTYDVCAFAPGANANTACAPVSVVAGSVFQRAGNRIAGSSGDGAPRTFQTFARSGFGMLGLLLVAAVIILVGVALRRRSRLGSR